MTCFLTGTTVTGVTVTTAPGGCVPKWTRTADTRGFGAVKASPDTSLPATCQDRCYALPNCVALDFDSTFINKQYCWVYLDKDTDTRQTFAGVDHWVLNERCKVDQQTTQGTTICTEYKTVIPICQIIFFKSMKVNAWCLLYLYSDLAVA